MQPFGILADDLTGACDSGVQFSARGARVCVALEAGSAPTRPPPEGADWDVTVVNTESRHLAPDAAAARVAESLRMLDGRAIPLWYKKIDSTLRGNLAEELVPVMLPGRTLVVCPAFPRVGRTVEGGRLLVDGEPVHTTALGRDSLNPVLESAIPALLREAAVGGAVPVLPPFASVEQAEAALGALAGERLLVADAVTDAHLLALAGAMARREGEMVGVGSAGLAGALASVLWPSASQVPAPPKARSAEARGPVLVVAGSRHPATRAGVAFAERQAATGAFACPPQDFDSAMDDREAGAYAGKAVDALLAERDGGARMLVLSIAEPRPAGEEPSPETVRLRSARLNSMMGEIALALHRRHPLAGLVLTGGDTARSVMCAFRVTALQLGAELRPGIPLGWCLDGTAPGLPVVTKAGGFGDEATLAALAEETAG